MVSFLGVLAVPFQQPEPAGLWFHRWLRWSGAVLVAESLQGRALPSCLLPSSPAGLEAAEKLMQAPAMLCLRLSFVSAITYGSTSSQVSVLPAAPRPGISPCFFCSYRRRANRALTPKRSHRKRGQTSPGWEAQESSQAKVTPW